MIRHRIVDAHPEGEIEIGRIALGYDDCEYGGLGPQNVVFAVAYLSGRIAVEAPFWANEDGSPWGGKQSLEWTAGGSAAVHRLAEIAHAPRAWLREHGYFSGRETKGDPNGEGWLFEMPYMPQEQPGAACQNDSDST